MNRTVWCKSSHWFKKIYNPVCLFINCFVIHKIIMFCFWENNLLSLPCSSMGCSVWVIHLSELRRIHTPVIKWLYYLRYFRNSSPIITNSKTFSGLSQFSLDPKKKISYFSSIFFVFHRETRRSLERLTSVSSQDFPVTVVLVARWYLLRHLHAKGDDELINVST